MQYYFLQGVLEIEAIKTEINKTNLTGFSFFLCVFFNLILKIAKVSPQLYELYNRESFKLPNMHHSHIPVNPIA